jgi:hypothetical protein
MKWKANQQHRQRQPGYLPQIPANVIAQLPAHTALSSKNRPCLFDERWEVNNDNVTKKSLECENYIKARMNPRMKLAPSISPLVKKSKTKLRM